MGVQYIVEEKNLLVRKTPLRNAIFAQMQWLKAPRHGGFQKPIINNQLCFAFFQVDQSILILKQKYWGSTGSPGALLVFECCYETTPLNSSSRNLCWFDLVNVLPQLRADHRRMEAEKYQ